MRIKIRKAKPTDAINISQMNAQVQQLHADAYPSIFKPPSPETFPPSKILGLMETQENHFFIAEIHDSLIGYLYAESSHLEENPFRFSFSRLYIHQIGVRPEFQGMGCGKLLMNAARELAEQENLQMIMLDTWGFNEKAQNFFSNLGYETFNFRYWYWLEKK